MPFYLSKSEQRALLFVAFIIITAILIEWIKPHQIHTKIYDYSLQDSLFKALSAQPVQTAKGITQNSAEVTPPATTPVKKKIKKELQAKSININKAGKNELTRLPRIGPKMAERIIAYRKTNGPFKSIDEIKKVKGIGNKTFNKLAPFIIVQ
jgi:comEA protein